MTDTSDPAFPGPYPRLERDARGMSLRDYFAGQALIGLLAYGAQACDDVASDAYAIADAMLDERVKS